MTVLFQKIDKMRTKLIDKDPFSNGTGEMIFREKNCEHCIKYSRYNSKTDSYTSFRCSIDRDIVTRMFNDHPIASRTCEITNNFILYGYRCPLLKTTRPPRKKNIQR